MAEVRAQGSLWGTELMGPHLRALAVNPFFLLLVLSGAAENRSGLGDPAQSSPRGQGSLGSISLTLRCTNPRPESSHHCVALLSYHNILKVTIFKLKQ